MQAERLAVALVAEVFPEAQKLATLAASRGQGGDGVVGNAGTRAAQANPKTEK